MPLLPKKWGRLTSPPTINMRDENHLWGCAPGVVPGFFSFCNRAEVLQFQPFYHHMGVSESQPFVSSLPRHMHAEILIL